VAWCDFRGSCVTSDGRMLPQRVVGGFGRSQMALGVIDGFGGCWWPGGVTSGHVGLQMVSEGRS
jgi:hypothetical protein